MTNIARTTSAHLLQLSQTAPVHKGSSRSRERTAAELARLVETSFVGAPRKAGGVSVKERFSTLEKRFLPEKAKGVNVRLQFDLSGSDGGKWYIEIKDGKIKVTEGTGPKADATVIAKASDYKKMAEGEMNKTFAFLRGKLKIQGDRKYLDAWETWFKPI